MSNQQHLSLLFLLSLRLPRITPKYLQETCVKSNSHNENFIYIQKYLNIAEFLVYMQKINLIPEQYLTLSPKEIDEKIISAKLKLGNQIVILGHNYQREDILKYADFMGDSYKLCQLAMRQSAKYIIFCGVHFMAESADILSRQEQKVILPDLKAGCSMADMANISDVEYAWKEITAISDDYIPITYINSSATIKAFCGKNNGLICTSSNAIGIFEWALSTGKKIIFFPDEHLGRYAGLKLGIRNDEMLIWNPKEAFGGNTENGILDAKIILWKGFCYVHQQFKLENITELRKKYKEIKIIVHPECSIDVLNAADYIGSTEFIIQTVSKAPLATKWAIGTEIHLVDRLRKQFPDKLILSVSNNMCLCSTMYRINPPHLLWVLEGLLRDEIINQINVPEGISRYAKIALDKMLTVTDKQKLVKLVELD